MDSLKQTDGEAAAVAVAPRVALADIEAAISLRLDTTARKAVGELDPLVPASIQDVRALDVLSLCILVLRNGFTIVGKSAPASPDNFDAELGRKFAYEDAVRQIWPLMGFALRDRLYHEAGAGSSAP